MSFHIVHLEKEIAFPITDETSEGIFHAQLHEVSVDIPEQYALRRQAFLYAALRPTDNPSLDSGVHPIAQQVGDYPQVDLEVISKDEANILVANESRFPFGYGPSLARGRRKAGQFYASDVVIFRRGTMPQVAQRADTPTLPGLVVRL